MVKLYRLYKSNQSITTSYISPKLTYWLLSTLSAWDIEKHGSYDGGEMQGQSGLPLVPQLTAYLASFRNVIARVGSPSA